MYPLHSVTAIVIVISEQDLSKSGRVDLRLASESLVIYTPLGYADGENRTLNLITD